MSNIFFTIFIRCWYKCKSNKKQTQSDKVLQVKVKNKLKRVAYLLEYTKGCFLLLVSDLEIARIFCDIHDCKNDYLFSGIIISRSSIFS